MKVLLDNCIDIRVKRLFAGHEVTHARDLGWRDLENGRLLTAAANAGFAVMCTVDKNIRYQQNLSVLPLSIIELNVVRSRFVDIAQLAPFLATALEHAMTYRFVSVATDGRIEVLAARGPGHG